MSLVEVISRQTFTISKGEKCLCLRRYLISLSAVSIFDWLEGFETRAQKVISSFKSLPYFSGAGEVLCDTSSIFKMSSYFLYDAILSFVFYSVSFLDHSGVKRTNPRKKLFIFVSKDVAENSTVLIRFI